MRSSVVAHETQEEFHTFVQGAQGFGPALDVLLSLCVGLLLPSVIDGQIECTSAPGDGDAVSQAREEIVLAHELGNARAQSVQIVKATLDVGEHVGEYFLVNAWIGFVDRELLPACYSSLRY